MPITIEAGIMSVIERDEETKLDQWTNAILAQFIAEGYRVVTSIRSEAAQVAGVALGYPLADLLVML